MKEIPILFSTPMVQAILAGRKMQTRRVVQPMRGKQSEWLTPGLINSVPHGEIIKGGWQMHHPKAGHVHYGVEVAYDSPLGWVKCPYGQPGDLLWVRETYCPWGDNNGGYAYKADGFVQRYGAWERDTPNKFHDVERIEKWKPSIFMPKPAARTWLQITAIRVERLRDISEEDAIAEGVEKLGDFVFPYKHYAGENSSCIDAKTSFQSLWQKINGDESWAANPWVWCLSFKILSTTGKPNPCPKS